MVWRSVDALQQSLTQGYARAAAAAIVQDHFRAAALSERQERTDTP
jgi:hypothetical protein